MASKTRSWAGRSPPAELNFKLLPHSKSLAGEAIQDLELKLRKEFGFVVKEQTKLRNELKSIIDGFACWQVGMENKINIMAMPHLQIASTWKYRKTSPTA